MTESSVTGQNSAIENELADLCRKLVSNDKVNFEKTAPIRKWLAKKENELPGTEGLVEIASRIKKPKSKSKKNKNAEFENLQEAIKELINGCQQFLRNAAKSKLKDRTGADAVRKAIYTKYLVLGLLTSVVLFGVILNGIVWTTTEKWLVPIPIGEEMPQTIDFGVLYFVLFVLISIPVSLWFASMEFKTFQRIFIQILVRIEKKTVSTSTIGEDLQRISSANDNNLPVNWDQNDIKTVRVRKYFARVGGREPVGLPASIGERFRHNDTAICGETTKLTNGKKKLWGPYESI